MFFCLHPVRQMNSCAPNWPSGRTSPIWKERSRPQACVQAAAMSLRRVKSGELKYESSYQSCSNVYNDFSFLFVWILFADMLKCNQTACVFIIQFLFFGWGKWCQAGSILMLTQSHTNDCRPRNFDWSLCTSVCVVVLSPSPCLLCVSLRTQLRQFIHTRTNTHTLPFRRFSQKPFWQESLG